MTNVYRDERGNWWSWNDKVVYTGEDAAVLDKLFEKTYDESISGGEPIDG